MFLPRLAGERSAWGTLERRSSIAPDHGAGGAPELRPSCARTALERRAGARAALERRSSGAPAKPERVARTDVEERCVVGRVRTQKFAFQLLMDGIQGVSSWGHPRSMHWKWPGVSGEADCLHREATLWAAAVAWLRATR